MQKKIPIFYSALLLTGVNLTLRFASTSFQVYISGRIGAAGVGLLQLVLSVGALCLTAGIAGARTATMYLTAEELGKKRPQNVHWVLGACFLYSIAISGTVSLLLHRFAPWIASRWIGDARTVRAIRLFACFLPISCLCGVMTGYFTAANRIGTLAAVEIGEQLVSMGSTMSLLVFWAGSDPAKSCESVVLGSGIGGVFTLLCLLFLRCREHAPTGPRIPVRRRLLETAVPLALADDLKSGISTAENLMVPKRLALYPGSMDPLADFGRVCGMVFPLLMFPACILFSLAELLIPELARCAAAGSHRRIRYLAGRSLRIALFYGLMSGGILFLTAEDLCMTFYKSQTAGQYLQLYALLVPMLYCDILTDAMTKGLGQQKICVRYNIITASMDVMLLFLLLPGYGMAGYFFSFTVTHFINLLLSLRRLIKIAGKVFPFGIALPAVAATVLAVLGANFLSAPLLRCGSFLLLLGSLWVLFQVVDGEDLTWLQGLLHKK